MRRFIAVPRPEREAWLFLESINDCPDSHMVIGSIAVTPRSSQLQGTRTRKLAFAAPDQPTRLCDACPFREESP